MLDFARRAGCACPSLSPVRRTLSPHLAVEAMAALSLLVAASAFMAPLSARVGAPRSQVAMQLNKKVVSFDQDGVFEGREISVQKPPLRLLARIEELQLATNLAEAGLLSAAEEAGVFSKLEAVGAFSQLEQLLPLADKLKLLSTAEALLNTDAWLLSGGAAALLIGELGLITVIPDDNAVLVGLQLVTGVAAGAGAVTLLATSYLFSLLQGEN